MVYFYTKGSFFALIFFFTNFFLYFCFSCSSFSRLLSERGQTETPDTQKLIVSERPDIDAEN